MLPPLARVGIVESLSSVAGAIPITPANCLEQAHGLERTEAYVLASLAADLRIGAVVDAPHAGAGTPSALSCPRARSCSIRPATSARPTFFPGPPDGRPPRGRISIVNFG
jgi:hypothetical protein